MKSADTADTAIFELKGSVLTVMVLHLKSANPDLLYPMLQKKIGPARSFFNNAPLLIDLKALSEYEQLSLDFLVLSTFMRGLGLVPVAVRCCTEMVVDKALSAGLGILPAGGVEKKIRLADDKESEAMAGAEPLTTSVSAVAEAGQTSAVKEETVLVSAPPQETVASEPQTKAVVPPVRSATMVITQPVRSGQQIVAAEGDLILLSSVNPGAEVVAAGNIHVYGPLRGRALAGVHGNTEARVFSLLCNPELVAVADAYVVNDLLDRHVCNRSVIISHRQGQLDFRVLGTFDPY